MHQLIDELDDELIEEGLDQLKLNLVQNQKTASGQRVAGQKYCADVGATVYKPRGTLLFSRLINEELHVYFPGGSFVGASDFLPIVEYINANDVFAVQELPVEVSDDTKVNIANELIKQGLLRLREHSLSAV